MIIANQKSVSKRDKKLASRIIRRDIILFSNLIPLVSGQEYSLSSK